MHKIDKKTNRRKDNFGRGIKKKDQKYNLSTKEISIEIDSTLI